MVKNIYKNHNEEERKKAFTRLYIEIINKLIKLSK
jgi:hypothetical protein